MHDTDAILALRDDLGDAAWTHHEFCKFAGEVAAIDLPIVWRTTMEGISDINRIYEKHGFIVYEAHNAKVPWMAIVGEQEQEDGTVSLRLRTDLRGQGIEATPSVEDFITLVKQHAQRPF